MAREFDYGALNYEQREGIHNALAATTVKHISGSEGLFGISEFAPAANPSHMLEVTHLEPVPTTRERVNGMAAVAGATLFPAIQEAMSTQRPFMSSVRMLLGEGKNLAIVTGPHGKIADVAEFEVGFSEYLDEETWQEQSGLIISRGVTTIEAFGTAASQVVQEAGHVFMSFPRTQTIEDLVVASDIMAEEDFENLISTNNSNMRKEARDWLEIDVKHRVDSVRRLGRHSLGKALFTAWEGKTAGVVYGDDHRPEKIAFQRVHPAIVDILKHCIVVPVTIWDDGEQVVELGELTTVKDEADIVRVQDWQRSTLAARLGIPSDAVTVNAA